MNWLDRLRLRYYQWRAWRIVRNQQEIGALLMDYKNGQYEMLMSINGGDVEGEKQYWARVDETMTGSRDEVLVTILKTEHRTGYMMVFTSEREFWSIAFHPEWYPMPLAFVETAKRCRKYADKMGFVYRGTDEWATEELLYGGRK